MKKPDSFCSTTYPFALRLPRICDGLLSLMRLQTTDEELGCTNIGISPKPILKLCQLIKVRADVWMVSFGPELEKVAVPWETTGPAGLANASRPEQESNPIIKTLTENREFIRIL